MIAGFEFTGKIDYDFGQGVTILAKEQYTLPQDGLTRSEMLTAGEYTQYAIDCSKDEYERIVALMEGTLPIGSWSVIPFRYLGGR